MSGHHKFSDLEAKMGKERLARSNERVRRDLEQMLLTEIRKLTGMTQAQLAEKLGVSQSGISQLEQSDDMRISTLKAIVNALGGELQITVKLPEARITLDQFSKKAA